MVQSRDGYNRDGRINVACCDDCDRVPCVCPSGRMPHAEMCDDGVYYFDDGHSYPSLMSGRLIRKTCAYGDAVVLRPATDADIQDVIDETVERRTP